LAVDYGVAHAGKVTIKPSNGRYFLVDSSGGTAAAKVASAAELTPHVALDWEGRAGHGMQPPGGNSRSSSSN